DHPCAADLDLFGQGSLFQLLSLARTRVGAATLARWLLTPATPDVVRLRQCAVEELRANTALREDLALYAQALAEDVDAASLSRWSQEPDIFPKPHFRHIARVLVILGAVAAILSYGADSIWPCIYVLTADVIVLGVAAGRLKRLGTALEEPRRELNVLGKVIARFQREPFQCPLLKALRERFYHEQMAASAALQRLDRLSYFFEMQANQLFAPFSIALLWGIHIAYRIEAWRKTWGAQLPQWLEAVGELEALASLACFAYERAEYVFPELREGVALFEADGLKHPLLPGATCVENSLHLDAAQPLLLVSGSNMSGKSTLLRTAGINTILAMAGAPVAARRLALGPLRAGATIAVHDSIQGGVSRFYAEIKRLKQLMDFAQDQDTRLLFLLDEILHGTNSHDRRIGAEAILTKLLERGAIGLVTTHDLAITGMGGAMVDKAVNAHFEDTVGEVGPVFDYRLKPGVVQRSNALALMRSVGLDV
ncbi:MAG: DNA mismatch repair protein MutS, partial [Candidatus Hydrogenedentes bacterium]|nr:DNA mismatch repair protein MutS [Candidatus Hydrogenedentota bacterium]